MAAISNGKNNFLSTRMLPLVLLLALWFPAEVAGRIGATGSVHQKKAAEDHDYESSGRDLGGYNQKREPTTGIHGGHKFVPKHGGHYDYSYIKRPVDPSEYYHNWRPNARPTASSHSNDGSNDSDDSEVDKKPTRRPTRPEEGPTTKFPTNFVIPVSGTPGSPQTPPTREIELTEAPILWSDSPTAKPPPTKAPTRAPVTQPPVTDPPVATEKPVPPPTFEPVIEIEIIEENPPATIQERISEFALRGGAEFEDPNSYQSAALRRVEEQVGAADFTDIKLMQYYALYSIFESTSARTNDFLLQSRIFGEEIPSWTITSGWLENDVDPCEGEWYGVYCEDDRVVQLDLFDNGLTGNFAPEVVYLAGSGGFYSTGAGNLVSLDIFGNEFMSNNGDMSWIQDMGSQLGYLYLQNTLFSGKLPPRFPEGLVELDIANSMITGDLSGAAFENLSSLRFLLLDGVQFNSTIPSEIAKLPNLEYLFATDASITGDLSYMRDMPVIFEHWVDRNPGLGGSIPAFLGDLTTLQSFSIADCGFTGTIPESLGNLGLMQQMWLYGNQLTGEIPASLGNLSFMRIFEVEENNLSDSMPQSICNNLSNGMLAVLGADCDKLDCPCCTCCTVDECLLQN